MWLANLKMVLPDTVIERGALRVEAGQIVDVIEGDVPGHREREINATGLVLMPGMVDLHGDMIEKELEPRPGVFFPTIMAIHELDKRLAANGVTTAYASFSVWDIDRPEGVRGRALVREMITTLNRVRHELLVDHFVHARYEVSTPSGADLVLELLEAGQLHLISLMDHTPGQGQYRDVERYIDYLMKYHRSNRQEVEREAHERINRAFAAAETNWGLARQIAAAARQRHLPLASHDDDTPSKVEMIAELGATMSEFPVSLDAAYEARRRGMHVIMGAPNVLRGGSHSGNLSAQEAIAHQVVDTLASDYAPAALLQAVFRLVERGICSLPHAVQLVSKNPADALGLRDRGQIAVGQRADLILVEPGAHPRLRATICAGRPVYWDATMADREVR